MLIIMVPQSVQCNCMRPGAGIYPLIHEYVLLCAIGSCIMVPRSVQCNFVCLNYSGSIERVELVVFLV